MYLKPPPTPPRKSSPTTNSPPAAGNRKRKPGHSWKSPESFGEEKVICKGISRYLTTPVLKTKGPTACRDSQWDPNRILHCFHLPPADSWGNPKVTPESADWDKWGLLYFRTWGHPIYPFQGHRVLIGSSSSQGTRWGDDQPLPSFAINPTRRPSMRMLGSFVPQHVLKKLFQKLPKMKF